MNYTDFLKSKVAIAPSSGFSVEKVNPALFPHQADSVKWACKGGRRAIFAAFGNGKTIMGLECFTNEELLAEINRRMTVKTG